MSSVITRAKTTTIIPGKMSSKLCYFFIILIGFQAYHISGRIVHSDNDSSSREASSDSHEHGLNESSLQKTSRDLVPGKELTDEEIEKMKQDMSKELTPVQLQKFGEILSKFKKGSSIKDHVEGMVELLIFAVAARSNATDAEIQKLFGEDTQPSTANPITLNNHI